jgi:hypothetical protein
VRLPVRTTRLMLVAATCGLLFRERTIGERV